MLKAAYVFLCFCPIAIKGFQWGTKEATPIYWGRVLGLRDECGRDLGVCHAKMLGFCNTHTKALYSGGSHTKALSPPPSSPTRGLAWTEWSHAWGIEMALRRALEKLNLKYPADSD
jgi:hypothetical protein